MFGLDPNISFTDSRAKHGNDRGEEKNTEMTSCGQLDRDTGSGANIC
jgi:hypothetical protein